MRSSFLQLRGNPKPFDQWQLQVGENSVSGGAGAIKFFQRLQRGDLIRTISEHLAGDFDIRLPQSRAVGAEPKERADLEWTRAHGHIQSKFSEVGEEERGLEYRKNAMKTEVPERRRISTQEVVGTVYGTFESMDLQMF